MLRRAHPADDQLLLADARELTPRLLARTDEHVAHCDTCRRRRTRLQTAIAAFRESEDISRVAATTDLATLRRRLQNALREEEPPPSWPQAGQVVRAIALPLALAAAVLVGAVVVPETTPVHIATRAMDRRGDALPVTSFTPGAVSSLSAAALCAGERPARVVSQSVRDRVLRDYGMLSISADAFELDALVTPELGGTVDRANLWPQRYDATWNAHVKDALENLLAGRVCSGLTPLSDAQQALADDWISAYKKFFQTDAPIPAHLASMEVDEDVIVEHGSLPPSSPKPAAPHARLTRDEIGQADTPSSRSEQHSPM